MIRLRPHLEQLPRKSYEEESKSDKGDLLDCALGRNSFGTSERVAEFAKCYNDWSDLWQHPDTSYMDLKQEICRFWSSYADLKAENVKVANGSCVVLSRLNKLFVGAGVKVLGYVPQFIEYMLEVKVLGGIYEALPLDPQKGFKFNPESFLSKIKRDFSVVYIDNPNNPTGQLISLSAIENIVIEARKKGILVIMDEAYGDYVEEKYSAVNLVNKYENLVVTRTFTKGYGVGRFRVGYAILSAELGDYYDRIALPFSVSSMGAALAREALLDQDFIRELRQAVKAQKGKLIQELSKRGYLIGETCESCALFILGHKDKDADLRQQLLEKGILTSIGEHWENLDKNWVRINTPLRAEDFIARLDTN